MTKTRKVCVFGLGTVGYPTALHIKNMGYSVFGYDIDRERLQSITSFPVFFDWTELPKAEIYVVCVSTGWKNGSPDMTNVYDACQKIRSSGCEDLLLCIESSVAVGTCREVSKIFDRVKLVHVPHRYWVGNQEKHGVVQPRVLGALDDLSLDDGKRFYEALGIPVLQVSCLEVAEMTKIVENAYRFVQISFVEEIKRICDQLGLSFDEVRENANKKWNIHLLEARDGIGGDCLPKDIRYVQFLSKDAPLLKGAVTSDKLYKELVAKMSSNLDLRNRQDKK